MGRYLSRQARRSLWNRTAAHEDETGPLGEPPVGKGSSANRSTDALQGLAATASALRGNLAPAANQAMASVRAGLGRVEEALSDPTQFATAELMKQADLPELRTEAPLASLAVRLDREADLWRSVAFRQLERAAWAGRLIVIIALLALAGEIALAALGGFRVLFAGLASMPSVLLIICAAIVAAGALIVTLILERTRQSQLQIGKSALVRADLAEARLHRIAILMELGVAEPQRFVDALSELEQELRQGV